MKKLPERSQNVSLSAAEFLRSLNDPDFHEALHKQLRSLGMNRFRLSFEQAEDATQDAFATYLEVRGKYKPDANSQAILFGIFFNKCREAIGRAKKAQRRLADDSVRQRDYPDVPTLIVKRDHDAGVRAVIESLNGRIAPLIGIATGERTRGAFVEEVGNRNTADSRLHAMRGVLKRELSRNGITISPRAYY